MAEQLTDDERIDAQAVEAEAEVERLRAELGANALLERVEKHYLPDTAHGFHHELKHYRATSLGQYHLAGQAKEGEHPSEPSTDTLRQQVEYWRNEALAGNALLERWADTVSALTGAMSLVYLKADTETHIAGQAKAGPVSKLAANMAALGLHHIGESREDVVRRVAAPAQVKAEPRSVLVTPDALVAAAVLEAVGPIEPGELQQWIERRAAEQRVLDAMAKARITVNNEGHPMMGIDDEYEACRAELALRELNNAR